MPIDMDKMMREMMARMPKELSEVSDVTDEAVALAVASALAHRTLGLIKSTSKEGGISEHIRTFTLLFTLVQRLNSGDLRGDVRSNLRSARQKPGG